MHTRHLALIALLLGISGVLSATADSQAEKPDMPLTNVVAVSVVAMKQTYELGEEIILSVTVSNTSAATIRLLDTGSVLEGFTADVHTENGRFAVVPGARPQGPTLDKEQRQGARSMRSRTTLAPGQAVTYSIPLERWVKVDYAGTYRVALVRGESSSGTMRDKSNTIVFEVTAGKKPN